MKVRKRPITVQAIQLRYNTTLETPTGVKAGRPGDWLIEDIEGDQYIIRKSVFDQTYDVIDTESAK